MQDREQLDRVQQPQYRRSPGHNNHVALFCRGHCRSQQVKYQIEHQQTIGKVESKVGHLEYERVKTAEVVVKREAQLGDGPP